MPVSPAGIVGSLLVCTALYVLMCLTITGMQPFAMIDLDAPFAAAFEHVGMGWAKRIVAAGALTGAQFRHQLEGAAACSPPQPMNIRSVI